MINFDRLRSQFKNSTKFKDFLDALFRGFDDFKTPIEDIRTKTDIDNAEGVQVDLNGKDLGIGRNGLADPEYKILQATKIKVNNSNGTVDEIISIAEDLAQLTTTDLSPPALIPVVLFEPTPDPGNEGNAVFQLNIATTIKTAFRNLFKTLIQQARSAGIRFTVVHGGGDDGASAFRLDGANGVGTNLDGGIMPGQL